MTTAFISAVTANPWGHSYPSLLHHIRKSLIARGLKRQRPQLTSSQKFPMNRPFSLTDIVPNHNIILGRQYSKDKRKRKHHDGPGGLSGGGGFNPMIALLGGLAGGLLFLVSYLADVLDFTNRLFKNMMILATVISLHMYVLNSVVG